MEQFSFKSSYMKSVTLFKSTIVVIHYCEFNTLHKYLYDGCIITYVILHLKNTNVISNI